MPSAAPLTRRRALAAGGLAGLAAVAARSPASAPAAVRPRGFTLGVAASDFGEGGRTGALRAPRRFDVVGVRGRDLHGLEIRVRERGGSWSPWVPVGHGAAHRPDAGTGAHASDPVWAGGADELELRAPRGPRRALQVHFVSVGALAKRRGARAARSAPAASAARSGRAAQAGPPAIITRAEWGGDSVKPRAEPSYGEVQVGFVHHTVTANDYAPEESPSIVLGIAKYHRDTNGWNDVGYNFLVDRYGQVFEGRAGGIDQPVIGAQAQGYNARSTGVAILGTHGDVPATPAALEAVARLLAWKLGLHGVPVSGQVVVESAGGSQNRYASGTPVTFERISGHRDGDSTSCPGNALYAQLPTIRRRAAELAPTALASVVRLGLQRLEGAPRYGADLAVAGTLVRPDGSAVAGQRIEVQKRGTTRWVTVARATTDAEGSWQAAVTWRRAGRVRARAAVPGSPVAVTPTTTVGLTPVAELTSTARRVRAGSSVALDALLLPVEPADLLIEREVGGRYRRVGKLRVRPRRSRSRIRVPLRRPGLYRLTLRAEIDGVAVRSTPVVVRAVRAGRSLDAPAQPGGGVAPPGGQSGAGSGGAAAGA